MTINEFVKDFFKVVNDAMSDKEFTPAVDPDLVDTDLSGWKEGPLCECDVSGCRERLPLEAWRYVNPVGQAVVLPLHTQSGSRRVYMDGFAIEEDDT